MKKNIFLLLFIIFLTSCLDKIELDVPKESSESLVVQGGIVRFKDKATVDVQFRGISDERGQSRTLRVKQAYVENDKNQKIDIIERGDGIYGVDIFPSNSFNIEYGTKYRVFVETFNGTKYQSDFKELIASPNIDNLTYDVVEKDVVNPLGEFEKFNFLEMYVNTKVKDEKGNRFILKYDIINAFKYTDQLFFTPPNKTCYVTQKADLNRVLLYDARETDVDALVKFPVYNKKIDWVFSEGYYGTVVQQAIDEETYDYFFQVNELNNREGSIYESPAGKIITNIKNISDPNGQAYGYFYAVTQDTARISVLPSQLGNPKRQCPVPPSENSICPITSCCDCLRLKGASLTKPYYWN